MNSSVEIPKQFKPSLMDRFYMHVAKRAAVSEFVSRNDDFSSAFQLLDRLNDSDTDSTESEHSDRFARLRKLRKMFKGEARLGNEVVGSVTGFHAALQFGQGIVVTDNGLEEGAGPDGEDRHSDEFEAWQEFMDVNDYSEHRLIRLAVSGELDGQILLRLMPDEKVNTVRAWTVPLLNTRYRVEFSNPWEASRAILFEDDTKRDTEELLPHEFVFTRFRGVEDGTYGIPRGMRVIERFESLSAGIEDWRKINRIYASPTPVFSAKDNAGMQRMKTQINGMNWKIGKAFLKLVDDAFELIGLTGSEHESLRSEIVMNAQLISAATGVPVHHLGFPELMSNRSVADSDMEPALKEAELAHVQYVGFFEELKEKVFAMLNVMHGRRASNAYDPDMIEIGFPSARKGDIGDSIKAWLPARVAGEISRETFHTKIGLDPAEEAKRLEDEAVDVDEDEAAEEERILRILDDAADDEAGDDRAVA